MRIGYPCINLTLPCRSSRTFRLSSWSERRFLETVDNNLSCLLRILEFNANHGLLFFRITSDLVPFASHPICQVPWQRFFDKEFRNIGDFIKRNNLRVSMHPDQFTLINSPDEEVFQRSRRELLYHCDVMDLLGLDQTHRIQIHVGGAYGDKNASMDRFVERYKSTPLEIHKRLVVENDDRLYCLEDCLRLHERTEIPIVFDVFHHRMNNRRESLKQSLAGFTSTWSTQDGLPIVDYSGQEQDKKPGTHATSLDVNDFADFVEETKAFDFDIMLEIEDKEKSALTALEVLQIHRENIMDQ
jgi:UV DNA damage endonuclease